MMNLEAKVDNIRKALVGIEAKLDQIIEKQNVTSRPASLDRLQPKKTKKEIHMFRFWQEVLGASVTTDFISNSSLQTTYLRRWTAVRLSEPKDSTKKD